jgi:hypothetical protein
MKINIETKFNINDIIWTLDEGKFRQFKILSIRLESNIISEPRRSLPNVETNPWKYNNDISIEKIPSNSPYRNIAEYEAITHKLQIVYHVYPVNVGLHKHLDLSEETDLICSTKEELIELIQKLSDKELLEYSPFNSFNNSGIAGNSKM